MTTYEVTAWCIVPHYTTFDVDAGSLGEALEKAKLQAKDEYGEPCDGGECDWDEFEIFSEGDGDESVRHLEPLRLANNAAPELLEQLQRGVNHAQSVVDSWERGDLAATVRELARWLAEARLTLNQATKQDASTIS
jgi:hypothetical protein